MLLYVAIKDCSVCIGLMTPPLSFFVLTIALSPLSLFLSLSLTLIFFSHSPIRYDINLHVPLYYNVFDKNEYHFNLIDLNR